jgi:hypothetical protein
VDGCGRGDLDIDKPDQRAAAWAIYDALAPIAMTEFFE